MGYTWIALHHGPWNGDSWRGRYIRKIIERYSISFSVKLTIGPPVCPSSVAGVNRRSASGTLDHLPSTHTHI